MIVGGKPISKFRYFEDLGLAILESIPGGRLWRVALYLKLPPGARPWVSQYKSYGHEPQRSPKKKFCGQLIIDGKLLQAPLRYPMRGKLPFIPPKGPNISAHIAVTPSEFVDYIAFEFKRNTE